MKKLTALVATATLTLTPVLAKADTILGLYVGAQGWSADYDGHYGLGNNIQPFYVDDDDTMSSLYVALEHPVPFIPNVKVQQNNMDVASAVGNTKGSFDNTDYTLYYEIFDNDIVAIDIGINGKQFDGDAQVLLGDEVIVTEFSDMVPTAYAAARIGLPFTDWTLTGEAKAISLDDSKVHDVQAALEYRLVENLAVDVSLSAGYRSMKIELDDVDNLYSDMNFNGPFVSVDVHF